jgi:hypothetical protein
VNLADTRPCADPSCSGTAEPEQDGDHAYHVCDTCQYHFGYTRITVGLQPGDPCSIGIPEATRRAHSRPMTDTRPSTPPLLQIGRRPDALHAQGRLDGP